MNTYTTPTRVLVIDDSALMRQLLTALLESDASIQVVGSAPDPVVAWEQIKLLKPDVLTLDVEMPRMDGLTFLERLMMHHPLPVGMVSSLTEKSCDITLRALELGAIDFVTKPKLDVQRGMRAAVDDLIDKVKAARGARLVPRRPRPARVRRASAPAAASAFRTTHSVLAIGASTGGTHAVRDLLSELPPDAPGVVVVQHLPERFTRSFAKHLDADCQVRVKEAEDGDRILPGHVLIAPGGRHMKVTRSGTVFSVALSDGAPVNRFRPSVDVLFHSCALQLGKNATGVLLTGMGDDGARGLLAMRAAGAATIAQDEATCVVFGMPRAAIALGAAARVLALGAIAGAVMSPVS